MVSVFTIFHSKKNKQCFYDFSLQKNKQCFYDFSLQKKQNLHFSECLVFFTIFSLQKKTKQANYD